MANARLGSTWYIDTATSALTTDKNLKIAGILLTATAAGAILVLREASGSANKLDVREPESGKTAHFDFSVKPLVFGNGIYVQTLTNAVATLIMTSGGE